MSPQYKKPVPLKQVQIRDSFWDRRISLVKDVVVPYQWEALNDRIPGIPPSHAVKNFEIAAGRAEGEFRGCVFQDSDVAKWLEAASYTLATHPDEELRQTTEDLVDLIVAAQQEDGYLNTYFTIKEPDKRWTNTRDLHELYCAGHMMEAAVAYYEATGNKKLLNAMCRFADHIGRVLGTNEGQKPGYPGHPEVELALCKMYQATGEKRYLDLAKYFVDQRGQKPYWYEIEAQARGDESRRPWGEEALRYSQAHLPVREQEKAEGHAVRAMYLFAGMADVARETMDQTLTAACRRLWDNVTNRRMYITGGIGSDHWGERFTFDYDLPNDTAYAETCAAIGLVFWAHRMLQLELKAEYSDVMERALYNGVLSGISLDGTKFFYVNPLAVWPEACRIRSDMRHVKAERQGWFGCACCPPNVARLLASLGQYICSTDEHGAYVHLYIQSEIDLNIRNTTVHLSQETRYPWEGRATINVTPESDLEFTLGLRLPGWARGVTTLVNGDEVDQVASTLHGYLLLRRLWRAGDRVELVMPMPIERMAAHPNVRENAGKVALQRGPIVYCLEEVDNGPNLTAVCLPRNSRLEARWDEELLGGVLVITGDAVRTRHTGEALYRPVRGESEKERFTFTAVPYSTWSNRQPGEMQVWIGEC